MQLPGQKLLQPGNTLCSLNRPLIAESIYSPEPVVELRIEPKTKVDQEKMSIALSKIKDEDPSLKIVTDIETNQTLIKGMGELHLEIIVVRLKREYKVEVNVGEPRVAYREAMRKSVEIEYIHKKQSGGAGQFAKVNITFEPLEAGSGFVFMNKIVGGAIPKEYIPGVEKGIEAARQSGILAGYPVTDFKATLFDGAFHDVDSSILAFDIASKAAFREGMKKSHPCLLEPIMEC